MLPRDAAHDRTRGHLDRARGSAAEVRQPHAAFGRARRAGEAVDARRRADGVDGLALRAPAAGGIEAAAARFGLPWRAHRLGGRSGYCLEPELPRDAREASRWLDVELIDTRRLHMANRGVWDAIAGAGPAASFAHSTADVDEYLTALEAFLGAVVGGRGA